MIWILTGALVVALFQLVRYRCAYKQASRDADMVMDDLQKMGAELYEELEELEDALDKIVETSTGPHVGIATEVLAKSGRFVMMSKYCPAALILREQENKRRDAEFELEDAQREAWKVAHPWRYRLQRLGQRISAWWQNPS